MKREELVKKIGKGWEGLRESYRGMGEEELMEKGVVEDWSVKDILAHVTTWEEEALRYLPVIVEGGKPPRYSIQYGGIDAFNALRTEQKRGLSLEEVLRQMDETHRELVAYIEGVPDEQFEKETPFRHRLRLDTYSHYPLHERMIREWRAQRVTGDR